MFEGVLKKAKVDPKREVSRTHGFRKFFITLCDRSGMSFSTREFISGHRLPNQDVSYIRVTEEDRLTQYVKAIPLLTISDNQRLAQENQHLKTVQAQEIERLKAQLTQQAEKQSDQYEDIRQMYKEMTEVKIQQQKWLDERLRPRGLKIRYGEIVDIKTDERRLSRCTSNTQYENPHVDC